MPSANRLRKVVFILGGILFSVFSHFEDPEVGKEPSVICYLVASDYRTSLQVNF